MITHPLTFAQRAPRARQKGMLAVYLLALCTLGLSANAQNPTFITFDPPGSIGTGPTSINSAGVITGNYSDGSRTRGFLRYRLGTFKTFDVPGAITTTPLPAGTYYTTPVGINPAGEITGYYSDSGGNNSTHGFVRARGDAFTVIDPPGSAGFTKALGIN